MVSFMMRSFALITAMIMAQPGLSAPAADSRWAYLAGNLFPAIEAIRPDRLPEHVRRMLTDRRSRIASCGQDRKCIIEAARWTEGESRMLSAAAERALSSGSRTYAIADDSEQAEVARQLTGLNGILNVYGLAAAPRYPAIDGPANAAQATTNASSALDLADAGHLDPVTRLDPSIGLAIALLDTNNREEAAAFEPLDARYNAAALEKSRRLDWKRYRFTAIIVPGVGPDDPETPLSARGKLNVRMAAQRFADGVAPFIILSGSSVHPRGTRFVEALEMRRALVERFGVPAEDIIVDPYARHTTTNLRNATRRLIALGAPLDRDALIITNTEQSRYIESAQFMERNRLELGYQPGKVGTRVSPNELMFRPSSSSMRVDPIDPLDP